MTVYRAAWICPIVSPPIENGWVAIRAGRIEAIGGPRDTPAEPISRDLGSVAILPGLVNAHTHLELSWLRDRVPPAADFVSWIKQLMLLRGGRMERADDVKVLAAVRDAIAEARQAGTIAFGDISNSLASVRPLCDAGLDAVVFHELLGFQETDARLVERSRPQRAAASANGDGRVRVSIAPHAPYSVSPELFRAIRAEVSGGGVPICSVHLGESKSETGTLTGWVGAVARNHAIDRGVPRRLAASRHRSRRVSREFGCPRRSNAGGPRRPDRRHGAAAIGQPRQHCRDLPAEQSMGGRGCSTDRAIL